MTTPNGSTPASLELSESQPGPAHHRLRDPGQEITVTPVPQRFDMKIHATDGQCILRLFEADDGTFQCVFTPDRLDEAAVMFANQVAGMSGRRLLHGTAHPDSPGAWLARQPLGAVVQPVAANIMNMAWHAALEAGLCDCPQCVPQQIGSTRP